MTPRPRTMNAVAVAATVVWASFVVLMSEIVATRMIAPYVGVTLETLSAVIGVVLAGISIGSWLGGRLADKIRPVHCLGPALFTGGLLLACSPLIIRARRSVGQLRPVVGCPAVAGRLLPAEPDPEHGQPDGREGAR